MEGRLLYKPKECAEAMGVSKSWLYAAIKRGDVPVIALGPRCLRIPVGALERVLQSKMEDPEAW